MTSYPVLYEHLFSLHQTVTQKPVRYQCNQPRSVRAENLAPEVVTLSPFCSHLTLCFLISRCVFLNDGRHIAFYVAFKIRAKGNDVVTNVICPNQHFASTFSHLIFKFQRRTCCCKPSFLFPPRRQGAPDSLLAC